MKKQLLAGALALSAMSAQAQEGGGPRPGWSWQLDGFSLWQGESDLTQGGAFAVNRGVVRGGVFHTFDTGVTAGVTLSMGRYDYEFSNVPARPWGDITDLQISAPIRFAAGDRAQVFVVPSLGFNFESGAGASSGRTYGVFGGIAWQVSENLTIGPAVGFFTQLEDDNPEIFPALLIDWSISDQWSFSTGSSLGATQGPGLTLSYAATDSLNLALSVRSEDVRFRLNNSGPVPGGIGQDSSIPVVFLANYEPNPGLSLTAFAGAEFNGELTLADATGTVISQQNYDTAPIVGLALRLRF